MMNTASATGMIAEWKMTNIPLSNKQRLLCYNPRERSTAKQALRHRFMVHSKSATAFDGS
jgi:hypothetical protein